MPASVSRVAVAVALVGVLLACSGSGGGQPAPAPLTKVMSHGRFTVHFSAGVIEVGRQKQEDIVGSVERALNRIDELLPGPHTSITITVESRVIAEIGTLGQSFDPSNSFIRINPKSQVPFHRTVVFWLPRTLAHEIHHQVRSLAGPGFGRVLLEQLVSEGTADVFDGQAFPGAPNPWDQVLTPDQEHRLWAQVQPDLQKVSYPNGLYGSWMFGDPAAGIPRWSGFTIGYHMASGYVAQHPGTNAESLAQLSAHDVVTGSGYQP
jgi:uncharacterized protein YjaZ